MKNKNKNNNLTLFMLILMTTLLFTSSAFNEAVSDVAVSVKAAEMETSVIASELPDFSAIRDTIKKKRSFFSYMRPIIEAENARVLAQRERLIDLYEQYLYRKYREKIVLTMNERAWLNKLKGKYRVNSNIDDPELIIMELIMRVDMLPVELAMTQAAKESGWGGSRFARTGNNVFGQQCFVKGCGIIPVKRNEGAIHEVKKFKSISASVRSYIRNLNTNSAYDGFRKLRFAQRQAGEELEAYSLISGLPRYSERGEAYLDEIRTMMLANMPIMGS